MTTAKSNSQPPRFQFSLAFLLLVVTLTAVSAALAQRWPVALVLWCMFGLPAMFRMVAERQVIEQRLGEYTWRRFGASLRYSALIVLASWSAAVLAASMFIIIIVPPLAVVGYSWIISDGKLASWPAFVVAAVAAGAAIGYYWRHWPMYARTQSVISMLGVLAPTEDSDHAQHDNRRSDDKGGNSQDEHRGIW